jgi:hypothetical protein
MLIVIEATHGDVLAELRKKDNDGGRADSSRVRLTGEASSQKIVVDSRAALSIRPASADDYFRRLFSPAQDHGNKKSLGVLSAPRKTRDLRHTNQMQEFVRRSH